MKEILTTTKFVESKLNQITLSFIEILNKQASRHLELNSNLPIEPKFYRCFQDSFMIALEISLLIH